MKVKGLRTEVKEHFSFTSVLFSQSFIYRILDTFTLSLARLALAERPPDRLELLFRDFAFGEAGAGDIQGAFASPTAP